MTECMTGSYVTDVLIIFVLVLVMHAVSLACLFVRWGHRCYWAFPPAIFSALSMVSVLDHDSPCALIRTEFISISLAVVFYFTSYLFLIFFKPSLRSLPIFSEVHVPAVIAWPGLGALYAGGWLLLSLGRDRLWMDTGMPVPFKDRLYETLIHGVVILIVGAIVASRATG